MDSINKEADEESCLLLLGNKCDIENHVVYKQQGEEKAKEY